MNIHNVVKASLVGLSLLGSSIALAGDVNVNCPVGTKQTGGFSTPLEATACVKTGTRELHGPYVGYAADGSVAARGSYKDGFRDGKFTFFDANGVKTGETEFLRGDYHGKRIEFFANGKPRLVETYVNGSREGVQQEFDLRGNLVSSTEFRNDRKVASAK